VAGLGLRHGLYCIGFCWALMALLFVGAMKLWVAVLAVFVLVEKLLPDARWVQRTAGAGLIAVGAWMLMR
jgi:predicted metal-binding membrane protein